MAAVTTKAGFRMTRAEGDVPPGAASWEALESFAAQLGDEWNVPEGDLGDCERVEGTFEDEMQLSQMVREEFAHAELVALITRMRAVAPRSSGHVILYRDHGFAVVEAHIATADARIVSACRNLIEDVDRDLMMWLLPGAFPPRFQIGFDARDQ